MTTNAASDEIGGRPRKSGLEKQLGAPPVRAERVADQVYRNLRRAILDGEFKPGSRIREVEVAKALQVSRTPVREAVSRLIGDRLVRELAVGGVEVIDTTEELYEIYVVREALESSAARLAAARATDEQIDRLEAINKKMGGIDYKDVRARDKTNHDFHLLIAEMAGSPRLLSMIQGFREFFMNPHKRKPSDKKKAVEAFEDHRAIIKALRKRDGATASAIMRAHLEKAYEPLIEQENAKLAKTAAG